MVDLGSEHHEAVAGEPPAPAERRLGQLEDVGVEDDPGPRAAVLRAREERPHAPSVDRHVDVLGLDHHAATLTGAG